jgi:hypothetical protein
MSHRPPRISWDHRRAENGPDGPALTVPADLSSLSADAREVLRLRLSGRTPASSAEIRGTDADGELVLVGLTDAHATPELRTAVEYFAATVQDDVAAGWSVEDELAVRVRIPTVAGQRLTQAAHAHRPILGRRLIGPFSLFSSAVFAIGLAAFFAVGTAVGSAVMVLAFAIRTAEAYDAWTRMPAPPRRRDR